MNALNLDAIEKRAAAATPGPWEDDRGSIWAPTLRDWVANGGDELGAQIGAEDVVFITHARDDLPALVAEVRRVRALTEDDVAQALVAGSRWSAPWERMTGQEQEWVRQQARPVLALILGAEQDAADVVEFPGPVEFDFTPGGGDAA